jgi:exonuclease III
MEFLVLNDNLVESINNTETLSTNHHSMEKNANIDQNSSFDEITFNKKGINFLHLNIHYLYPKLNEIKYLVDKYPDIDVLGLQETFLSDVFSDSEISLNNYQMFRRDRKSNGGGIILFVKSTLPCELRSDLQSDDIESIWLEMKLDKQ